MGAEERTVQPSGEELGNRTLLVLYGTETGNSQEIAQEIAEAAERLRFQTAVEEMNDVALKELVQYSRAVFVTSTTGQGDVPVNAIAFWKSLLRKKLPPNCLSNLEFTIFGLGDSSYPKFNWAARKLRKRLLQLGAVEFHPAGEGDEKHDNGIDSIYLPWFQGLKSQLLTKLPLPNGIEPIPDDFLLPPKFPIQAAEMGSTVDERWEANLYKNAALSHIDDPKSESQRQDDEDSRLYALDGFGQFARQGGSISDRLTRDGLVNPDKDNIIKDYPEKYDLRRSADKNSGSPGKQKVIRQLRELLPIPGTLEARVLENRRVTPQSHWQDVRLLTIELLRSEWWGDRLPSLHPGNTVTIYPKNFPADVETLIKLMGWESVADKMVLWDRNARMTRPRNMYPPDNATLRDILLHNIDFNAVPSRTFLKGLQRHTQDEREKERLLELTQESNTQEFYDYTSRPRRTILEVLQDFPGVKIPMEYALEMFPAIRGRMFSIANNAEEHQSTEAKHHVIELLVALVEYKTIIRKPRQGLCSRYVKSLKAGQRIVLGLSRSHCLPSTGEDIPRPLIAIATGTGIAPIRSLLQQRDLYRGVGQSTLFFGCRNKDADYYFSEEWPKHDKLTVIPAFSRDPINPTDKKYLDPYARQDANIIKPEVVIGGTPEPIGPQNTPWMKSFDYDRGKMYVQHQIRRYAKVICDAMDVGIPPIILICGNSGRMPTSVQHALEDALVIGGKASNNEVARRMLQGVGIWMETW